MKLTKLIAIVFAFFLTACIDRGTQINTQQIGMIQKGVTTEAQIRAIFGEPVGLEIVNDIKVLTYKYSNSDDIKKDFSSVAGALLGGVIGNQFGDGSGQAIATGVGAVAGGVLGENMTTTRHEEQILKVFVDMRTSVVVDYKYNETKGRSQSWGLNSGVGTL